MSGGRQSRDRRQAGLESVLADRRLQTALRTSILREARHEATLIPPTLTLANLANFGHRSSTLAGRLGTRRAKRANSAGSVDYSRSPAASREGGRVAS
jgi:hypothetical protein